MLTRKILVVPLFLMFVFLIISLTSAFAQMVDTAWVRRYNGLGNQIDRAKAIATDHSGNVYVTGYSVGNGTYEDYITIKYYSNGDTAWVRTYNGPGNYYDEALAMALDNSGNIYVTGWSWGIGSGSDYTTIKYYPNGDTAWVRRYSYGVAYSIAVDGLGNIYVTGTSEGTPISNHNYTTIKYDSLGNQTWVQSYDGPGNATDVAYSIAVDGMGNAYITGKSYGSGTDYDYATIKYDSSGSEVWVRRYDGPGSGIDSAGAIAIDRSGNVIVTGYSWGAFTYMDYTTIKYDSSGNEVWVARFDGPASYYDAARDIALDSLGNVYVTGWSWGYGTGSDLTTIKYYPNGSTAWVGRYSYGEADAIALDDYGNVYVTGEVEVTPGFNIDYLTIKYTNNGIALWEKRYEGTGYAYDWAHAIAIDDSNNVFVTGESYGTGSDYDYATIKYVQPFQRGVDLSVDMWGSSWARPGFQKKYFVEYKNNRADAAENVVLSITLPPQVQYLSCDPPTCNMNEQAVTWNLGTVPGFSGALFGITFYIPPSVPAGTILNGIAEITTISDDQNRRNNRSDEQETVVNSWDPNDKDAQPWGGGDAHYIMPEQTIRYTIFFENDSSATAEAVYIDIVDTLDVNLDLSTLEIGSTSHPLVCQTAFNPINRVLTWHFDHVMLPPNIHPPEGEGFVAFSIKPKSGLALGTQIKNQAYIMFDFNPWIAAPDSGPVIRTIGLCGDANSDGTVDVGDIVCLINYLFKAGPAPNPVQFGDANSDGTIDIGDVVYLINYLYKGGPPPSCEEGSLSSSGALQSLSKGIKTATVSFQPTKSPENGFFEIPLASNFVAEVAGVQLEVSYDPKDITLLEPSLSTRTEGLQLYSDVKDGVLKIGILDMNGQNYIAPGEGPLVTLRAQGNDLSSLVIKDAILVDKDANKIPVEIVKSISTMENHSVPQEFTLSQNIPNPFNPETEISYLLPSACQVKLSIYNLLGEKVKTLVDGYQTAGHKTVRWDGADDLGNKVASGVYFYKLKAGEFTETKKMIMMK